MRTRLSEDNSTPYEPKRDVQLFCYALVSEQAKGSKEKAQVISGVDKGKFYWAWKTEPRFRAWYQDLCMQILSTNSCIPPFALLGNIVRGDTQAIRTFYELMGRLKNPVNVQVNTGDTTIIQTPHAVIFSAIPPKENTKEPEKVKDECQSRL